jgi:ATP-dependent Lon protease
MQGTRAASKREKTAARAISDRISGFEKSLEEFLGVPKYRYGEIESDDQVGIVTGLAWTDVGGEPCRRLAGFARLETADLIGQENCRVPET